MPIGNASPTMSNETNNTRIRFMGVTLVGGLLAHL
jgi:hypothetical protein